MRYASSTSSASTREAGRRAARERTQREILGYLGSPRFDVRMEAILTLEKMPDLGAEAETALEEEVERQPFTTAYVAARVLGKKKCVSAAPLLRTSVLAEDYMLQGLGRRGPRAPGRPRRRRPHRESPRAHGQSPRSDKRRLRPRDTGQRLVGTRLGRLHAAREHARLRERRDPRLDGVDPRDDAEILHDVRVLPRRRGFGPGPRSATRPRSRASPRTNSIAPSRASSRSLPTGSTPRASSSSARTARPPSSWPRRPSIPT